MFPQLKDKPIAFDPPLQLQVWIGRKFITQRLSSNPDRYRVRFCYTDEEPDFRDLEQQFASEGADDGVWGNTKGGLFKIVGRKILLYGNSSDYGRFPEAQTLDCFKDLFANHEIYIFDESFQWNTPPSILDCADDAAVVWRA